MATFNPKDFLESATTLPGVYQMLNDKGNVIYVGKAKNLKKRLTSYFRKNIESAKTKLFMQQVVDIQLIITENESEALLLESNLIKQLKPRYNILLRDDKSYPYLYLSTHLKYPAVAFHRGAKKKSGRYFGPYPSGLAVKETLAILQKIFNLRPCSDSFFANRSRPCIQYQMHRCDGPCVELITEEDYRQKVDSALLFLEGKNKQVNKLLLEKMQTASEEQDYEQAATLRDQLARLAEIQKQQYITGETGDIDIIGWATAGKQLAMDILYIRGGRVLGHKLLSATLPDDAPIAEKLSELLPQFYLAKNRDLIIPQKIVLSEAPEDKAWLEESLQKLLDQKIQIIVSKQGKYGRWISMANINAANGLSHEQNALDEFHLRFEALCEILKMQAIGRIECFDISHTQGDQTVASCVVCGVDGPIKKDYRHYNMTIDTGDDCAAMAEVIRKRYKKRLETKSELPDVILIDGGKGQVNTVFAELKELGLDDILLLGIHKGEGRRADFDKIYNHASARDFVLENNNPGKHLLQFIRDEAHRFAITAHRAKRRKKTQQSVLEMIPGIGAKRRQALLNHFGGLQGLKKASANEITGVDGMNKLLAEKIYGFLHES